MPPTNWTAPHFILIPPSGPITEAVEQRVRAYAADRDFGLACVLRDAVRFAPPRYSCTLDVDGCHGDDGEPCAACRIITEREERYWRGQWAVASPAEGDPDRYAQDMRDAGRGHLVGGAS